MKKIPLSTVILYVILLLPAAKLNAAVGDDFDARIDRGLEILYQGQYQDAIDTFDAFITQHPKNPAGFFFKAGNIYRMFFQLVKISKIFTYHSH